MKVVCNDPNNRKLQFNDKEIQVLAHFFDEAIDDVPLSEEEAKICVGIHEYLTKTNVSISGLDVDDDELVS